MLSKTVLYQVCSLVSNNVVTFNTGFGFGFLGPYAAPIMRELNMDKQVLTWCVSAVTIGGVIGCLIGGKMADWVGRRIALAISCVFSLVGWAVVFLAVHPLMVLGGRIIHGLGEAMGTVVAIMYLGELSSPKLRGAALASLTCSTSLGVTAAYITGLLVSWRTSGTMAAFLNAVAMLALVPLPESPAWLVSKGKEAAALTALTKLRDHVDVSELEGCRILIEPQYCEKRSYSKDDVISWSIPPVLLFLFPVCGSFSLTFFALQMASSMELDSPEMVSVLTGLLRTVGGALSVIVIRKYGRRLPLMMFSMIAALAYIIIAGLLYLKQMPNMQSSMMNWALVVLILASMFFNGIGISPAPWVLCGEWPDMEYKGLVNTLGTALFYISVFLSAHMTSFIQNMFGMVVLFALFAFLTIVFLLVVFFFVPETSGLSYKQYQKQKCREIKM